MKIHKLYQIIYNKKYDSYEYQGVLQTITKANYNPIEYIIQFYKSLQIHLLFIWPDSVNNDPDPPQ